MKNDTTFIHHDEVYIVRNPMFSNYVKIGRTNNYNKREKGLNNTSVPDDYELLLKFTLKPHIATDCSLESRLHDYYDEYRYVKGKEFFELPYSELVKLSNGMVDIPYIDLYFLEYAHPTLSQDYHNFQKIFVSRTNQELTNMVNEYLDTKIGEYHPDSGMIIPIYFGQHALLQLISSIRSEQIPDTQPLDMIDLERILSSEM